MRVERRCHLCDRPIRGDVAYATALEAETEHPIRVFACPSCYFETLSDDEREGYHRELLPGSTPHGVRGAGATPAAAGAAPEPPSGTEPNTAGAGAIEVRDLRKVYPDGTTAVRGVSFTVERGEIYGVLGPNGAGKTTLIGMLGTLVKPTGGSARVADVDVLEDPDRIKPKLGFAMQEIGVDELATGREFLRLQGRLYGLSKELAHDRAERLLELFDLTEAAGKRIDGYSGGMKRRIDLAGALIHEPEIIFLDEPTEGLDPRGRREMWQLIQRLNEDLGATILLSTHYMEEADALCDRLAIMDQGQIVVEGRPDQLKATVGEGSIALAWDLRPHDGQRIDRAEELIVREGIADRIQRSGGVLHVYVEDPARATPPLLRTLEAEGLAPESLEIKSASLDDVYLAYTGRSLAEAERAEAAVDDREVIPSGG